MGLRYSVVKWIVGKFIQIKYKDPFHLKISNRTTKPIDRLRKIAFVLLLTVFIGARFTNELEAQEPAKEAEDSAKRGLIAWSEVEPAFYYSMRRYPKFYGEPNTLKGSIFERSYLLGDSGGFRDTLVDNGFYLDGGITQFFAGNISGRKSTGTVRTNGTATTI